MVEEDLDELDLLAPVHLLFLRVVHLWRDKWTALSGPPSLIIFHGLGEGICCPLSFSARDGANMAHIRQSRPDYCPRDPRSRARGLGVGNVFSKNAGIHAFLPY